MWKIFNLCLCALVLGSVLGMPPNRNSPSRGRFNQQGNKMRKYIIVTKEDSVMVAEQLRPSCKMFLEGASYVAMSGGNMVGKMPRVMSYKNIGIGYEAEMDEMALQMVQQMEDVDFVEEDQEVRAAEIGLGWHMDRVDQRDLPLDGAYNPKYTGRDVDIYVLDTGIRYSHSVFGGRAKFGGYDDFGGKGEDCHSHGTHVAGLAAGNITGAAVGANVYSIRVLSCTSGGKYTGVIAGVNHVMNRVKDSGRKSIISMSILGPKSNSLDRALKMAYEAGIVIVAAAGNYKKDACNYSPSSSPHVITVAGSSKTDGMYWKARTFGTNHGKCVDIFAPGQGIRSASHLDDNRLVSKSGTSMATPIVSGAVAMLLEEDPSLTPQQVKEELIKRSTKDVLDFGVLPASGKKNTPNRLVYVESMGDVKEPIPTSTAAPQPTSTAGPVTTTEMDTMITTPTPTPTATPRPTPTPEPLPEKPNKLLVDVLLVDVNKEVKEMKEIGFVPTNVNAYTKDGEQYFTISFTYVGESNVDSYKCIPDLYVQDVDSFLSGLSSHWSPIAVAPYGTKDEEAIIFLVLKFDDKDLILSMEKTMEEFDTERTTMRARGYEPVAVRYRLLEDGSSTVYTIYQKWGNTFLVEGLELAEVVSRAYSEKSSGNYLSDISYFADKDGSVTYTTIFKKAPHTASVMYVDIRYSISSLFSVHNILRSVGYHAVAISPVTDQGPSQTAFLTVYWR